MPEVNSRDAIRNKGKGPEKACKNSERTCRNQQRDGTMTEMSPMVKKARWSSKNRSIGTDPSQAGRWCWPCTNAFVSFSKMGGTKVESKEFFSAHWKPLSAKPAPVRPKTLDSELWSSPTEMVIERRTADRFAPSSKFVHFGLLPDRLSSTYPSFSAFFLSKCISICDISFYKNKKGF